MRGDAHPALRKANAIALRQQGQSLTEIAAALGISKITIQGWVQHVRLTDAQRERLRRKEFEARAYGRSLAVLAWRKKIATWKAGIRNQVAHLGMLPFCDPAIG